MPNIWARFCDILKRRLSKTEKTTSNTPRNKAAAASSADEIESDTTKLRHYLASQKEPVRIKIAVFGSPGIGKKCFMRRLTTGIYLTEYDPGETYYYPKNLRLLDRFLSVEFFPCIAEPSYKAKHSELFRDDFIIVTYNVGNQESFDDMQKIYEQSVVMRQRLSQRLNQSPSWHGGMVVALADDLSSHTNAVSRQLGVDFAQSNSLDFFVTSAKTGLGCTDADLSTITMKLLLQAIRNSSLLVKKS